MKIAAFGNVTEQQLASLKKSKHTVLATDHPGDKALVELLTKLKVSLVVCNAEWRNIDHATSVKDNRISHATGQPEVYNKNGGITRDALMLEQADAIILGEGVSDERRKLIVESNLPTKTFAAPKLTAEQAQAELDSLFAA